MDILRRASTVRCSVYDSLAFGWRGWPGVLVKGTAACDFQKLDKNRAILKL